MKNTEEITLALSPVEIELICNGLFLLRYQAENAVSSAEEYPESTILMRKGEKAKADLPIIKAVEDKMWQIKYDAVGYI